MRTGFPLACTRVVDGDVTTLRPVGELDLAGAPLLDEQLRHAEAEERSVVVDLRGLTFMDCAGLHVLVRSAGDAERRGRGFRLIPGPERVHRVFTLTGVLGLLPG